MMISRFNRLFEKHGRLAFILMGIVVVVPFVIWVTPGGRSGAGGRR